MNRAAPKSTLNRWVVVAAAFSAQFILEGIILALDVLPPYILRYFHSTNAEVTLFGAVVHGFSHILGPVSSLFANKFGDRRLLVACSIIATTAFLAASLASKVWHLVVACAFVGISFGLASVPPVTVVSFHFKKNRHLITSGTTTGGAIGGALAPFLFQYLLDTHPWQHCFVYMGAAVLHLAVCGVALVRPKHVTDEEHHAATTAALIEDLTEDQICKVVNRRDSIKSRWTINFRRAMLPVLLFCTFLWHVGYDAFEIMPLRLADEGMTGNKIPLAISLHAIFDIFGRLSAAMVVGRCDQALVYNGALILGGAIRIALAWPNTFSVYLSIIAASGFCFGAVKAAAPSVLLDLVGVEKLNFTFGLWLLTSGLGGMTGPPLSGFLVDTCGNFFVPFLTGGLLILAASLPLLPYHWPLSKWTLK